MHLMAFANDNSIGCLKSKTLLFCALCLDVKGICRPRARFDRVEQGGNDGAESSDAYQYADSSGCLFFGNRKRDSQWAKAIKTDTFIALDAFLPQEHSIF
jgi:hypothetical protein